MFRHASKFQYPIKVDTPGPQFAERLQRAIGGIEDEIRVAMRYVSQARGGRAEFSTKQEPEPTGRRPPLGKAREGSGAREKQL